MSEKIANLFLFINAGVIDEIGIVWHDRSGPDDEKISFLQFSAEHDVLHCKRHKVKYRQKLTHIAFMRLGFMCKQMEIMEKVVFSNYDFCPDEPLMVLTCLIDGKIKIDAVTGPPC